MSTNRFWALIAASGRGERMQTNTAKQYLTLSGKPIIDYSIELFGNHKFIDGIMLSINSEYHGSSNSIYTCLGGNTRSKSVLYGLRAIANIDDSNPIVLVHDAARPCLCAKDIDRCIKVLCGHPDQPLVLAHRSTDSIKTSKLIDGIDYIEYGLDRNIIWQATTPQCSRLHTLKNAMEQSTMQATDEAGYLEQAGHRVRLLEATTSNIKITVPEDLAIAETLLKPVI